MSSYNYLLNINYNNTENDDDYRKDLLNTFNLGSYNYKTISDVVDNEIIPLIRPYFGEIYKLMRKNNKFLFNLDESKCVTILFSWAYYHLFYRCVVEIKKDEITDSITNLYAELLKSK